MEKKSLPGFVGKTLEFTAGNGDVCDALEFACLEMKKGERATLTCSKPALCIEVELGLKEISAGQVILSVELLDFKKEKDHWSLSEEEKLEFAVARKEVGSNLFRKGRIVLALEQYSKVADLYSYTDNIKDNDVKAKGKELKNTCDLNMAACRLKLGDYARAKMNCNDVLKGDAMNVKALFRRAQAELGLLNFTECLNDVGKVLERDPQNKDVRRVLKEAQIGQKAEDKKHKGMYSKMCGGLGKGPIPEPYEDKRLRLRDEMEDDLGPDGIRFVDPQ